MSTLYSILKCRTSKNPNIWSQWCSPFFPCSLVRQCPVCLWTGSSQWSWSRAPGRCHRHHPAVQSGVRQVSPNMTLQRKGTWPGLVGERGMAWPLPSPVGVRGKGFGWSLIQKQGEGRGTAQPRREKGSQAPTGYIGLRVSVLMATMLLQPHFWTHRKLCRPNDMALWDAYGSQAKAEYPCIKLYIFKIHIALVCVPRKHM